MAIVAAWDGWRQDSEVGSGVAEHRPGGSSRRRWAKSASDRSDVPVHGPAGRPVRGSSRPPAREAATNQVFRCAHQLAGVAQSSGVPVHGAVLQAGRFHSQVLMSLRGPSVPQGASGSGYRPVILSRSCGGCIYTKATMLRRRSAAAVHAVATLCHLACSSIL